MLQVDLVRRRAGVGLAWEILFIVFSYIFEFVVNLQFIRLGYFH